VLFVLLLVLPLAASAQTVHWVVLDRDGKLVGPVLLQDGAAAGVSGFSDVAPMWVARRIPGGWLRIPVAASAVWVTSQVPFLYEEQDCSGRPLLDALSEKEAVLATVVFDTDVYWSAGPAESHVIRASGVLVRTADACQGSLLESGLCCSALADEETHLAAEVLRAKLADLNLRPPFRLETVAASGE